MTYSPKPARWCTEWAEHPDVAAPSSWWLYHHDGHLAAFTDPRGPFARCTNGHTPPRPLSTDADPPGP